MKIGCLVLNYNDYETTSTFINHVCSYDVFSHICVVDNCSTDNSYELLKKYECNKIDVIKTGRNGGYGYGNNYGIEYLSENYNCDYILLANPDVIFDENLVLSMLDRFDNDVAIIAPLTLDPNGKPQLPIAWKCPEKETFYTFSSLILNRIFKPMMYPDSFYANKKECFVDCVQGSLLLFKTDVMRKYGMYDEDMFLYFEESTLGIKLKKKGYKTKLCMDLSYVHNHSQSINKTFNSEFAKRKIMLNSLEILLLKEYEVSKTTKLLFSLYKKMCLVENFFLFKFFSWLIKK